MTDQDGVVKMGFIERLRLIAWLYFKRWNIEKSFDNTKNTLHEKKAWANGRQALVIQSHAISFVYNVMRMFHEMVIHDEKAGDNQKTLSEKKYCKQLVLRNFRAESDGRSVHPLSFSERMARIPSAFVRCFRSCFFRNLTLITTYRLLNRVLFYGI